MKAKILGLITARGGSKRVPRKNIKEFCGKPLLAWTVEVGKASGVLDRFILSTEDAEIAKVGKDNGIEVPFTRPAELASDTAGSFGVVKHVVEWLHEHEKYEAPWIILLEPSSPGRQTFHLQEIAKLIDERSDFDSLIGVSETPGHVSFLKQLTPNSNGILTRVGDGAILRNLIHRNQDVPKSYFINSAVYAFKTKNLFDGNNSLWGNSTYGYIMDSKYALDIDTPEDWLIAEVKMHSLLKEQTAK
jgi:CMP-N-acetylneuraminic acid synthetase